MRRTAARAALAGWLLLAAACVSIDHNVPAFSPISAGGADRLTLYADANGHLYPDDWRSRFDPERVEDEHSLLAADNFNPRTHRFLREERDRQLDGIAASLRGRSRVFVLVHGFNNNHAEARLAFDVVRSRLPLLASDGVVEFLWDGLSSAQRLGQGAMWFSAAGYSQLAGTQALRGLLARLADKPVVVIAHSRGTSVTLSALSDPAYAPSFRRHTRELLGDDFGSEPLPRAGAPIDALFLAPAIGNPDFWTPAGTRTGGCDDYRAFPARLRSIHYTVNPGDPVLRKFFAPFSSRFNATDLGYDGAVGRRLEQCYSGRFVMQGHDLDMDAHSFIDYALDPVLPRMLAAAGISAR